LHTPTIAEDQALTLLQHQAEHIHELARADRFHQVVAQLRQMPVEDHSARASRWRTSGTPDAQKQGIL
jgi:hypothetical protein